MAKKTINNGDSMGTSRSNINDNFTELYTSVAKNFPGGVRVGYLGGSTDAKQLAVLQALAGDVTGDGTTLTVRTTPAGGLHDGELVRVGSSSSNPGFDQVFAFGKATRDITNGQTFSVPYSGVAGTSTSNFSVLTLKSYTSPSLFREVNALYGGTLRLVCNLSQGSTDTSQLIPRIPLLLAQNPDIVMGGLGLGNLYSAGFNAAQSIGYLTTAINMITAAGKPIVHIIPLGSKTQNAAAVSWGNQVLKGLQALSQANPLYNIVDPASWVLDPMTGQPLATWFEDGSAVHPNYEYQKRLAQDVKYVMQTIGVPVPTSSPILVSSIHDRMGADSGATNLCDGFFVNTGVNPTTVFTGTGTVSGTMSTEITKVTGSNAALTAVFSLEKRTTAADGDDVGYNQVIDISGGAAGRSLTIEIGGNGLSLASRLQGAGTSKKFMLGLHLKVTPSAADVVSQPFVGIPATMVYRGLSRQGSLGAALTNITEETAGPMDIAIDNKFYSGEMITPDTSFTVTTAPITIIITFAAAGTCQVKIGRPTVRAIDA